MSEVVQINSARSILAINDLGELSNHSLEKFVIALALTEGSDILVNSAMQSLARDDFTQINLQIVLESILQLIELGVAPSVPAVETQLRQLGRLEAVGGFEGLIGILGAAVVTFNDY